MGVDCKLAIYRGENVPITRIHLEFISRPCIDVIIFHHHTLARVSLHPTLLI